MNVLFAQAAGFESGLREMVLHSGPVAKLVLLILLVFSIVTWAIIGTKWLMFAQARRDTTRFLRLFRQHGSLNKILSRVSGLRGTPLLRMLRDAQTELQGLATVDRGDEISPFGRKTDETGVGRPTLKPDQMKYVQTVLERAEAEEITRLELALPFLATTGSTAPFIGLFGTVWGVMRAFQGIGATASTSIATVAPGISEALVATAGGLVAAIPAVMAYNHFVQKVRQMQKAMESFSAELRDYLEKRYAGG